jgi:NTP pyrophosphatase (non-canonical NTP hydrolase)
MPAKNKEHKMNELYEKLIAKYGRGCQTTKALEELSELIQAVCKYKSKLYSGNLNETYALLDNIAEEMADVEIMLEQLKIIFENAESVSVWKQYKLERIKELVK